MCEAVKPALQGDYQEMERLYGVCHCTNNLSVILILFDNNVIPLVRILAPYGLVNEGCMIFADHSALNNSYHLFLIPSSMDEK